jgi:mRNA interferase MazF
MQRGDVVAVADCAKDYTGKSRAAVIVQSDLCSALDSVTIRPVTGVASEAPVLRLQIIRSSELSLERDSWIAVTTVRRSRIGPVFARFSPPEVQRLNGALAVCLGIG